MSLVFTKNRLLGINPPRQLQLDMGGNAIINAVINAAQLTAGTLPVARLNGGNTAQFVRGDGNYASSLSNAASTTVLTVQNTQAGQFGEFYVSSNDRSFGMGVRSSTNAGGELAYLISNNAATPISIIAGGSERIRVAPAGNVTINAPGSGRPLQVTNINTQLNVSLIGRPADGAAGISFRNNADSVENAAIIASDTGLLSFWTSTTQRASVNSSGQWNFVAPSAGTTAQFNHVAGGIGVSVIRAVDGNNSDPQVSIGTSTQTINLNGRIAAGSFNNIAQNGDAMVWGSGPTVGSGALTLTVWSNTASGIRITSGAISTHGNVTINAPAAGDHLSLPGASATIRLAGTGTLASDSTVTYLRGTGISFQNAAASVTWADITAAGVFRYNSDGGNNEVGFRGIPQNSQGGSYTLVAADRGRHIAATGGSSTITVPASVFSIGDAITIVNATAGNITVAQGASTTLRQAGTTNTGNRTLAVRGVCTVICVGTNDFYISGAGLS